MQRARVAAAAASLKRAWGAAGPVVKNISACISVRAGGGAARRRFAPQRKRAAAPPAEHARTYARSAAEGVACCQPQPQNPQSSPSLVMAPRSLSAGACIRTGAASFALAPPAAGERDRHMDRKSDTHFDIGPSAASLRLAVLFAAFASVAAQSKGMLLSPTHTVRIPNIHLWPTSSSRALVWLARVAESRQPLLFSGRSWTRPFPCVLALLLRCPSHARVHRS